jgi:hypothetical protein
MWLAIGVLEVSSPSPVPRLNVVRDLVGDQALEQQLTVIAVLNGADHWVISKRAVLSKRDKALTITLHIDADMSSGAVAALAAILSPYLKPLESFCVNDRLTLTLDLVLLLADFPQALLGKLNDELVLVGCDVVTAF